MRTKTIRLTQGKEALVDKADYALVARYRWRAKWQTKRFYAATHQGGARHGTLYMHALILQAKPGEEIDHINGNGLDNRRANLRSSSHSQNLHNQHRTKGTSKYKGVSRHKASGKWQVHIRKGDRKEYLGLYEDEQDAAHAYDEAALRLFGGYASVNDV